MDVNTAVSSLMEDLPLPVQDFLRSDERDAVTRELSAKYNLHVDQAGDFERSFLFMLLGIASPEEFVSNLTLAGLAPEAISGLAADINTRVFMRLRDAQMNPVSVPVKSAPISLPALDYQPPAVTLPGSPVSAPMPAQTAPAAPESTVPENLPMIPSVVTALEPASQSVPVQHVAQAMPAATHQPGWHPAAAVHIFVPAHGPQTYQQQPAPVPQQQVYVPAPTPTAPEPVVSQAIPQQTQPVTLSQTTQPAYAPATPIKKDYGSDPYREPIQ